MASIKIENVYLDYPVYGNSSKLLTKKVLSLASAGRIHNNCNITYIRSLDNVSFELNSGDRLAIIGGNGAGKTSLLKIIAGIYTPSKGLCRITGQVNPILGTGFGLDDESTGYENIISGGIALGFSKREMQEKFEDITEFTNLGEFLKMPLKTYSAGMRTRLAFAITTSIHPEILVMDEGIGAGDATFFDKAKKRMDSFLNKASILIIASHSNQLLKSLCNKGIVMDSGKVLFFGNLNEAIKFSKPKG